MRRLGHNGAEARPSDRPREPSCYPRRAMTTPRTLVDKIWDDHVVADEAGAPSVLAIDLHLFH